MNTITTTASTKAILAIDLGKYKGVACVHDPATGEYAFTTFETTRAELRKLIDQERPGVMVIEACLLAGWVHDLCGGWHALKVLLTGVPKRQSAQPRASLRPTTAPISRPTNLSSPGRPAPVA